MQKIIPIICVILSFAGQGLAMDLAGIVLGDSLEAALAKYPQAECEEKDGDQVFDKKCGANGTVAGKDVVLIFQSKEGTVGSINAVFAPADYAEILRALTEQYGEPSSSLDGFAVWGGGSSNELISLERTSRNVADSGLLMLMDLRFAKQGGSEG